MISAEEGISPSPSPNGITAYPLLHAANVGIENGAILRPTVQPKLTIGHTGYHAYIDAHAPKHFDHQRRIWVEQQIHDDGVYTTYTWIHDASKKLGDEWRTGNRPITIAEGFAVKGDHPHLPITEELMEQIHQAYVPHLQAFFPLTQEQWRVHRNEGRHESELTFQIPTNAHPGQTLVPENVVGHLPPHDFIAEAKLVKEFHARSAEPNVKRPSVATPEVGLQSGSSSIGRPSAGATRAGRSMNVKAVGMGCAVAAIVGLGYLWYRQSRESKEAKSDGWAQRISRERQGGVAQATR